LLSDSCIIKLKSQHESGKNAAMVAHVKVMLGCAASIHDIGIPKMNFSRFPYAELL